MSTSRDIARDLVSITRSILHEFDRLVVTVERANNFIAAFEEHQLEGHVAPFGNTDCALCVYDRESEHRRRAREAVDI